ncbi:MAG TPA: methyltransferase [Gaiellaceae bacterium]|nr:methyltransferase [Gaiellaceae bacterium]
MTRLLNAVWRRGRRAAALALALLPFGVVRAGVRLWLEGVGARGEAPVATRRLLQVHQDAYDQVDLAAIRYDDGIHAKHRLTRYHDFFVANVGPGDRVLDVGCGKGELAADLADRSQAEVVGVDVNPHSLAFARKRFAGEGGLRFELMDVLEELPDEEFDVVVLSNVLEHFAERVSLLRRLVEAARPSRVLVRVPVLRRDWTVPLRQELGLRHFSDETHHIEYDPDTLRAELAGAGLRLDSCELVWGELWAVASPS